MVNYADCYVTVGEIELSYKMLNFYYPHENQKVLYIFSPDLQI